MRTVGQIESFSNYQHRTIKKDALASLLVAQPEGGHELTLTQPSMRSAVSSAVHFRRPGVVVMMTSAANSGINEPPSSCFCGSESCCSCAVLSDIQREMGLGYE